ncbi:ABC transporter ATP-binding protein [candidate division WWE3 bacterium]|uniref:ABC transporter ATP-binding protein n=1 Tax=candidate division WWE3 bacterium TaxID=2053526 RepID=A0A955LGI3_UNCKA|nr:ABC transporter ATP-binding protein [candidate division WWE3 bacterium]
MAEPNKSSIIEVSKVSKSFSVGDQMVPVLFDVSFSVNDGDFVIIFGPSGSGKSTLLHIMLGLEPPTEGTVMLVGEDIYSYRTEDDRAVLRKQLIGMVYQQPNWIKSLNVIENVAFPLLLLGTDKALSIEKARDELKKVNMLEKAEYKPTELSGGQQQRIALARALINNPEIIIADEPTGNLDFTSGQDMMKLLSDLNTEESRTIVMVTHDLEYIRYAKSVVRVLDGKIMKVYSGKEKDELGKELTYKRGFVGEEELDGASEDNSGKKTK